MTITSVNATGWKGRGVEINGIQVVGEQQPSIGALTDNSGGSAADTIAVIGATYDQAEVRNAIASLTAKVNALVSELETHGLVAS